MTSLDDFLNLSDEGKIRAIAEYELSIGSVAFTVSYDTKLRQFLGLLDITFTMFGDTEQVLHKFQSDTLGEMLNKTYVAMTVPIGDWNDTVEFEELYKAWFQTYVEGRL